MEGEKDWDFQFLSFPLPPFYSRRMYVVSKYNKKGGGNILVSSMFHVHLFHPYSWILQQIFATNLHCEIYLQVEKETLKPQSKNKTYNRIMVTPCTRNKHPQKQQEEQLCNRSQAQQAARNASHESPLQLQQGRINWA